MNNIMERPRVALACLGCKVNQFETAAFQSEFLARNVEVVPFSHSADLVVINTCAVTAKATAESRQLIRRAARINPHGRLVVTGCYAQIHARELHDLADRPIWVVGNGYKDALTDIALSARPDDLTKYLGDIGTQKEICQLLVRRFPDRTRAFLRIQDGCNSFCTYCIVPYTRGRSRSLAPDAVLDQAKTYWEEGYNEVVITGIHTGAYGLDLRPSLTLVDLLRRLEAETIIPRFRISSLEPTELSGDLLGFLRGSCRVMPHLHVPLQSGDDGILSRMNRKYCADDYKNRILAGVEAIPDIAIGVDVLVGFPGEDEEAFGRTREILERLPVAYLHVFPYSRRPGTPASTMSDQVSSSAKKERVRQLRELDHKKRTAFYGRSFGRIHRVLVEGRQKAYRLWRGFSENYIPVLFDGPNGLENTIVDVRIERIVDKNVLGRLV